MTEKFKCRMCGGDIEVKSTEKKVETCDYCGAKNSVSDKLRFRIANIGDIVLFGKYPQNKQNQKKDIEWIVLKRDENRLLLLSKYALEYKEYHYTWEGFTDWEKCDLRKWLNNNFIDYAFNEYEKDMILITKVENKGCEHVSVHSYGYVSLWQGNDTVDRVFLLSVREIQYFKHFYSDIKKCSPTEHAIKRGGYSVDDNCVPWWTRTRLQSSELTQCISVEADDDELYSDCLDILRFVRPALWVKL